MIRHLDYLGEQGKFALLSRCEALIMPSAFESLSVIVLEAWAMGRPVLVNAACKVLEGQCVRSGASQPKAPASNPDRDQEAVWERFIVDLRTDLTDIPSARHPSRLAERGQGGTRTTSELIGGPDISDNADKQETATDGRGDAPGVASPLLRLAPGGP